MKNKKKKKEKKNSSSLRVLEPVVEGKLTDPARGNSVFDKTLRNTAKHPCTKKNYQQNNKYISFNKLLEFHQPISFESCVLGEFCCQKKIATRQCEDIYNWTTKNSQICMYICDRGRHIHTYVCMRI